MKIVFAHRMNYIHKSFIREIMKSGDDPETISFAGGLPNPDSFAVREIAQAAQKVLQADGKNVLQYARTEGYFPLRTFIADRYRQKYGLEVDVEEILITTGSQQGLDLIGKIFLNDREQMVIERPGYLGAIQTFSLFNPIFHAVPLLEDGIDTRTLEQTLSRNDIKLFYAVPSFQNPSGITYSGQKRREVAALLKQHQLIFVEDNPYGDLRYAGQDLPPMRHYREEGVLLLGSFSKIVSPGLRLGWVCASREIIDKLVTVKQAADLHSSYLSQRVVYQYLLDNDLDAHISRIKATYKRQRDLMITLIKSYFPPEVTFVEPEGGMFVWLTLPEGISATDLFAYAIKEKVAFVPGKAFYIDGTDNTFRLNFSNSDEEKIEVGMKRLAQSLRKLLAEQEKSSL